jgi:methionyl aminopeptidase
MLATVEDIRGMRRAGRLAARLLAYLGKCVRPGISTGELDRLAAEWTSEALATSAPLGYTQGGYAPFPAHICTSINEVVCHGIPSDAVVLREGDIINIDVTPIFNGYHGDTSRTFPVGECSAEALELIAVTEECLDVGISHAVEGEYLGSLGAAIEQHANSKGYSIIKEFVGHGIGRKFHTQPYVPHYGVPNTGVRLKAGMIFTIEPILCKGDSKITFRNAWEAILVSGSLTAQAEHTILVGNNKAEILTHEPS